MYTIYGFDSFSKEEYLDFFKKLLLVNYQKEIKNVLNQPDPSLFYTLVVEFSMILEGDVNFGPLFIAEPNKLLPIFNEALLLTQKVIIENELNSRNRIENGNNQVNDNLSQVSTTSSSIKFNYILKKNCKVRVCDLPNFKEIIHSSLPRSNQVGLFVEFRGTVIRSGHPRVLEKTKRFQCSKCLHEFDVSIDFEQYNQYNIPKKCPNDEFNCPVSFFKPLDKVGEHCDYQEIKVQEQIHKLSAGSIPGSIVVLLQEDLVDICQAGDDIIVSGIVIRRWRSIRNDERCDIEVVLLANYVRVMNEQKFSSTMTDDTRRQFEEFWLQHENEPLVGRNRIVNQICSGVFGLFVVKLALLLILIGGVNIENLENGTKKRGECHLLLVGEPGTGKSQFLKFAAKVAQRAVLTTGIGTTTAGLTAASVKEPGSGEMVLEAGALVLADGGVCCIDEFSGIKTKDRATIHEAMEQQSLSIAKGGVISRLHTRTSIIAATNAKGKYDQNETLTVNTSLATPLLSRFDIILLLTDDKNVDWDREVSEFILRNAMLSSTASSTVNSSSNNNSTANSHPSTFSNNNEFIDDFWNLDLLQSYIYYVKGNFKPKLTLESKQLIEAYYTKQRANVIKANESRTTVRLLESLIRLSQAHARLMFRNTVEVQDAIISIFMLESSVESNCIFANLNAQRSIFPEDPELDYKKLETKIKKALGLSNLTSKPLPRNISKRKQSNLNLNPNWVQNQLEQNDEEDGLEYDYNNQEEQEEQEEEQEEQEDTQNNHQKEFNEEHEQVEEEENINQQNEEQGFDDIEMNDQFEEEMQDYNNQQINKKEYQKEKEENEIQLQLEREIQIQKERERQLQIEKDKQIKLQKEKEEKEKQLQLEREIQIQKEMEEKEKQKQLQIEKEKQIKLQKEKEVKEKQQQQQQQQQQKQNQFNDDFYGFDDNDDECFQLSEASIITPVTKIITTATATTVKQSNSKINNDFDDIEFDDDEDDNNISVSTKSKYFSNQTKTPDTQIQKDYNKNTPLPSAQKQYNRFVQLTSSQLSEFSQESINNNNNNNNNNKNSNNNSSFDLDIFSSPTKSVINNNNNTKLSSMNNKSNSSNNLSDDFDFFEDDILPSPKVKASTKPQQSKINNTKISNEEIVVNEISKLNTQDSLNINMSGQGGWSDDESELYQPIVAKSNKPTNQSQTKQLNNNDDDDFTTLDWD